MSNVGKSIAMVSFKPTPQPWNPGYIWDKQIHLSSGINLGYIPDKSGMLDKSEIYLGYIWDTSGIYP
jgi:hypothetical protein